MRHNICEGERSYSDTLGMHWRIDTKFKGVGICIYLECLPWNITTYAFHTGLVLLWIEWVFIDVIIFWMGFMLWSLGFFDGVSPMILVWLSAYIHVLLDPCNGDTLHRQWSVILCVVLCQAWFVVFHYKFNNDWYTKQYRIFFIRSCEAGIVCHNLNI